MLDFSFAEIMLIVVVAVVFIGPKELPTVVRMIGKAMRAMRALTHEIRQTFDELSQETGLKETAQTLDQEFRMIKGDDGNMYKSYNISLVSKDITPLPDAEALEHQHGE